jgi:hypothetical protein
MKVEGLGLPAKALLNCEFEILGFDGFVAQSTALPCALAARHALGH